ncbi:nuclear pore complex protein Nup160 [Geosmithia morbida]|uniref:Nuclear pore complex protein Nup160 n=1 Tax=Geosmithia morbida TaxID=1094350 RepID=A0A9P5D462_9HYPO|nr:nuclear pore complex protein Nup160 [Geosmithia morbida]KAF4122495.1 nuclear pore complex protein Nup160 [Geosmithia morbida]
MASGGIQYLFKETGLNLEPLSASAVVTVRVPGSSSSSTAPGNKRLTASGGSGSGFGVEDETTFRSQNLASASSIYHRQHHDTPRSFLWRVLEDGTTLSVRAVDVCRRDRAAADAPLILNFHFETPLLPGCVALADPREHDALCVFALDQSHVLWTFTLRPDLFRKRAAVDAGLSDLAKRYAPAGLSFKHPHRMVAVSADTLLVTVNDGGLMRLDRTTPDDASQGPWKDSFFNVQGWKQNLRSLLPFQGNHTIRYGKINMEYSAATSVQVTSLGVEDCLYAVTVCLDHRMRIWNLADGQILHTGDILDVDRPPQEVGRWVIDPFQSNLVQVVGRTRGQRICATYSPVGAGEFKFWKISAKGTHTVVVEDLFPRIRLAPKTPSTSDVWTLADFVLSSPEEGQINLWTLWKNNMTYKVQRLPLDRRDMAKSWAESWEGVFAETRDWAPASSGSWEPTDVTEKWLQAILQPGRFTKATLATALSIYEQGLGLGASRDATRGRGIAEAICTVLGATASLDRGASGSADYEQFRASGETQWRRFYRLLLELDKQRGEAIGLAVDPATDLAWVVCTDLLSAIRDCSALEMLYYNLQSPAEDQAQQAALIQSAMVFVDGFSDGFVHMCEAVLRPEIFEESSRTDLERIQYFSDKSGFWRGITDDDCAQVVKYLGDNFSVVTDELYAELLDLISAPLEAKRQDLRHPLSDFGRRLTIKAVQETIDLYWKVCFSQLILLVHMEFEFDNEDDALHHRVDIGSAYRQLVDALRRLELLRWLARTETSVSLPPQAKSSSASSSLPSDASPATVRASGGNKWSGSGDDYQVVTALEANLGHLLGFGGDIYQDISLATALTDLVANLCAPDSDIEISAPLIQCNLLRQDRADLALELSLFCDQEPFSVYVQARVFLALKDFESAANHFRKAAIGMGTESFRVDRHSSGLLDDTEWNMLNKGVGKYYSHVVALFERSRAFSYVIEFSRLAVQFMGDGDGGDNLTRIDLLSRLFNAAVQTCQFQLAHTTLLSLSQQDSALRHSSLRKLVDRMCETYHNTELVALPFPGMQQDVDDLLADRCRNAMDVVHGFPYHQVLYSWRVRHSNLRGAASVILDRIQKLRLAGEGDKFSGDDDLDTPVTRQYLLLINALSCVDPKQAWIYDEGVPTQRNAGLPASTKRKVVSLADIRKQYQEELDRIAAIQNNQFGFQPDDDVEIV